MPEKLGELTASQLLALGHVYARQLTKLQAALFLAANWCPSIWDYNSRRQNSIKKVLRIARKIKAPLDKIETLKDHLFETEAVQHHLAATADWYDAAHTCDAWILRTISLTFLQRCVLALKRPATVLQRLHYLGPSHRFGNIQFWQYLKAERYFYTFSTTRRRSDWDKFIACLYVPVVHGIRLKFDDSEVTIAKRAHFFSILPDAYVHATTVNYIAFKRHLASSYPHLFREKTDDDSMGMPDFTEMLLRAAKAQGQDEEIIAHKPLLIELKKLDLAAKDHAEFQAKQKAKE